MSNKNNKDYMISIAIPTYEMSKYGDIFLNFSLEQINKQTYKDIEIIISDHSINDNVENICKKWHSLNIKYLRNEYNRGSSSSNMNNALNNCSGEYIKLLFQDDYLYDKNSIQNIVNFIKEENPIWMASGFIHTHDGLSLYERAIPNFSPEIWKGNALGAPSVITIKNNINVFFDESLIWMMDCDFYKKIYDLYGEPKILDTLTVVNRVWNLRLSNIIPYERKNKEEQLMYDRYNKKII